MLLFVPYVVCAVLVIWALISGEMYAKEALIYGGIWLLCLLGLLFIPGYGLWFVAPTCLIAIILLVKLVGNPSVT